MKTYVSWSAVGVTSVAAVMLLGGCGGGSVSVGESANPAPAVTVTETVPQDPDTGVDTGVVSDEILLQITWESTSADEQETICLYYNLAPDQAWETFNKGGQAMISRSSFNAFFSEVC